MFFSVGGADYGSVRVGTFMGRKIIKSAAKAVLFHSMDGATTSHYVDETNSDEYENHSDELLKTEVSLDYLCNLSTHR